MHKLIKENRKKYSEQIAQSISNNLYRQKRYNFNFSIAIGLSIDKIDLSDFLSFKRETDEFIALEEYLYCLLLDGTNSEAAIRATSKLQHAFESKYFNKKIFIAVVSSSDHDNETSMLRALFDTLEYAITQNIDNLVIDESQMCKYW